MTLDKIPRGASAEVVSVDGTATIALRLMEMGMVPGARVRVVKSAPLGDPIHVCIRDCHLALRRTEAQTVQVSITTPSVTLP
jgi:Fe2+ transport system protein FeoA